MRLGCLAAVLLLAGCSDYTVVTMDASDVFIQNPADQVDILMVVDNSGSMEPYQKKLGNNFDNFIKYFVDANVDYHIGVVTTDASVKTAGKIIGDVITPETKNPEDTFTTIVNVGTDGSGYETGLATAYMALSSPIVDNANKGFLRDDANLSVIFVSDEEDSSPMPVNDYINGFFDIKGQRARDVFNASALTVTDESLCTADEQAASSPGDRYIDVAKQTNGLVGNLCEKDFADIVTGLSLNVSRLQSTFWLSGKPTTQSLSVSIDDTEVPCDSGEWTYQLLDHDGLTDQPAVVFDQAHLPPVGSQVTIRYYFGEGDVESFCQGGN